MPGGPYAEAAGRYRDAGWLGVLPVGTGPAQKTPPPGGYSGHDGTDPEEATVAEWCQTRGDRNIALRLPEGVVGIDIDAYTGKAGAATLQELQTRLGPLPDTWTSTSREDGVSGIRLYRTPPGFRPRRDLTGGVELVWRGHRYVVCAPSIHPDTGNTYRWVSPGGQTLNGAVPGPGDLPELPAAWADYLQATPTLADPGTYERATVAEKLAEALGQLVTADAGGRHDAALRGAHSLANYVVAGHPDAEAAMDQLGEAFVAAVMPDRPREARAEWQRIRDSALRKVEATGSWAAPPEPTPEAIGGPAEVAARHAEALVEWPGFWTRDWSAPDWLVEPVIARGRGHAIYAPAGEGKSEVTLYFALCAATGRGLTTGAAPGPRLSVVYFDLEMTEDDLHDRLVDFGFGPSDDLSSFAYYLLPDLPPLDTRAGGLEVCALAEYHRADLVIIDTTGRVVEGPENDADTYKAFARHAGKQLKADGRTLVRLDHAGKDLSRKQRGSSAKGDDVDVVWRLQRTQDGVRLRGEKRRQGWAPEVVDLARREPPLRYELATSGWAPGTAELAQVLDGLGVPHDAGRPTARAALSQAGHEATNAVLESAIRYRKQRGLAVVPGSPGSGSGSGSEVDTGQLAGQSAEKPVTTGSGSGSGSSGQLSAIGPGSSAPPEGGSNPPIGSREASERQGGGAEKARTLPSGEVVWPDHESYDQATEELP